MFREESLQVLEVPNIGLIKSSASDFSSEFIDEQFTVAVPDPEFESAGWISKFWQPEIVLMAAVLLFVLFLQFEFG